MALSKGDVRPFPKEAPRTLFGYEVIDFLGEGAGSSIYVVSDPKDQQLYALKHVVKKEDKHQRFLEQLENEFEVGKQLNHPGLRRCVDMKNNGSLFHRATEAVLVMELFDGIHLDSYTAKDLVEQIDIFIQVGQALTALHKAGYVHCDLKPINILISADGVAKVIDFGQACKMGTVKERIQGTPDYISPEQVKRDPVTARTDIFNFGATMYRVLTGKTIPTLFKIERSDNSFLLDQAIPSPRDVNDTIPETISNLTMECVRSNPAKRPKDMGEITQRLEVMRHAARRRLNAKPISS